MDSYVENCIKFQIARKLNVVEVILKITVLTDKKTNSFHNVYILIKNNYEIFISVYK